MSGGQAIELLARNGDPSAFERVSVANHSLDCNCNFAAFKLQYDKLIEKEEEKYRKHFLCFNACKILV